ncbi:group I truncated hemoglobin [Marinimicrobium alkaliphilum]|uniref:group I truncated hemoglobin n=1 Tax=Marinimicrobium alkaliphilum TaxID=2202654 RepID=UPI000DB938B5|nr:group 1 truncated hemoglobin [Marinimicrobium alkaliphilum]
MKRLTQGVVAVLALGLVACTSLPGGEDSLYQRLGGEAGIEGIVYELLVEIANDERIVERFRELNIARFQQGLETYLCSVTGGPCQYTGDSMRIVHSGHNFTDSEFNALVENLITAMNRRDVDTGTQNRLLAILARDYKDVVYL